MVKNGAGNISGTSVPDATTNALHTTLLDLVRRTQDCTSSDHETVAVITNLINNGGVVLTGSFAGTRLIVVPNP